MFKLSRAKTGDNKQVFQLQYPAITTGQELWLDPFAACVWVLQQELLPDTSQIVRQRVEADVGKYIQHLSSASYIYADDSAAINGTIRFAFQHDKDAKTICDAVLTDFPYLSEYFDDLYTFWHI